MDDPRIRVLARMSWSGVALAAVAAVLNGFTPVSAVVQWFVAGFVIASVVVVAIGLGFAQRYWRDMDEAFGLEERWRRDRERCR